MLTDTLRQLFRRDLHRLHQEITQYHHEENLWLTAPGIANPAGNLCLHLVGNLKTYIGAELGGVAYTRQRDLEFSAKHVPRAELLRQLTETTQLVDHTLRHLPASRLAQEYPLLIFEEKTSTEYFLVHLATHLAYHLGQVNYHRRLLDAQPAKQ
ncbi:DUF1572 family protein [Hymenobacter chitinivorans]|uniref:Uncharacterized protein DUF1572 n=1 Tax=Hymenobacter chitinivorans DSM 11115 TaxID=1121954 RepID=A0A2M9BQQ7_9BACT|nr:DUF1572 family protein [Hymenobacter chitinivorans]PJJ60275.1 uncharacterized protein DUF1572 [Hymenobacter chitinivorans DSM 11115]